jgi:microcystin-dependent protein
VATLLIPHTLINLTNADADKVKANFNAISNFVNAEVIQRDGSVAFTAPPTVPAPSASGHAANKQYVDQSVPAGVIYEYGGGSLPAGGYVWADGAYYDGNNPTYARLWAAFGTAWGGTGISSFRVPDKRGRFSVMVDGAHPLGSTGGTATNALSEANLPSHSHTISGSTNDPGNHGHPFSAGGQVWVQGVFPSGNGMAVTPIGGSGGGIWVSFTEGAGAHSHSVSGSTSASGGSSAAFSNEPPYATVNYIIKL